MSASTVPSASAACSSALATPPAMFAPARLWTRSRPVASRIAAIIEVVVVLPFVADTTTLPSLSPSASRAIACGSMRMSSRPGSEVPPRPVLRDSAPAARAAASLAPKAVTTWTRSSRAEHLQRGGEHLDRRRRPADRVAVGVDDERTVGVDAQPACPHDVDLGQLDVRALEGAR